MPIKRVVNGRRVPIKIWAEELEQGALNQLLNVSALPIVFRHVSAMADAHQGYGTSIGSVVATRDAIIPYAIGVDIGCGMNALKTNIPIAWFTEELLRRLRAGLERSIPVGPEKHEHPVSESVTWNGWKRFGRLHPRVQEAKTKAMQQMGSLGSGNHFLEVCQDRDGWTWIMLHSGSRGIGAQLAELHVRTAQHVSARGGIELPHRELAYLTKGSAEFDQYIHDMLWCQDYAFKSRDVMLNLALNDLQRVFPATRVQVEFRVNCHHNFAVQETHFGEEVWVTRKGAVRARPEDWVITPGSMGTRSYIGKGKGEPESFHSAPHGAGRKMSRTAARRAFTLQDLERQTEGVECRKDAEVLDEIPGAYKSIDEVMANSSDLIEPVYELKQVLCIKGGDLGRRRRRR